MTNSGCTSTPVFTSFGGSDLVAYGKEVMIAGRGNERGALGRALFNSRREFDFRVCWRAEAEVKLDLEAGTFVMLFKRVRDAVERSIVGELGREL